ncbi:MAG TPA: DUF1697 domain-containing protein [Phycisphaerales bacterium]|nr:DUF1697 domain-containing protein [Phycisphaerales bacterium]
MAIGVALIRGINVGSTRSLPMQVLRECCERVGMLDVRTYIQSGNVVFRWAGPGLASVAAKLEGEIEQAGGFRPAVVLRTRAELHMAVAANPFAARAENEPAKLLVVYLQGKPSAGAGAALDQVKRGNEQLRLVGREVFIDFPDGVGKSKLSLAGVEKAVGVGTARNWNTTLKLLAMADELDWA